MILVTALVPSNNSGLWSDDTLHRGLRKLIEAALPRTIAHPNESSRVNIVRGLSMSHREIQLTFTTDNPTFTFNGDLLLMYAREIELAMGEAMPGFTFEVIMVHVTTIAQASSSSPEVRDVRPTGEELVATVDGGLWGRWADYAAGFNIAGLAGRIDQLD